MHRHGQTVDSRDYRETALNADSRVQEGGGRSRMPKVHSSEFLSSRIFYQRREKRNALSQWQSKDQECII